ncbi:uncharacterized protein LOC143017624 isoform X3 [Oratosquilla oratoria]|uniref:uncharacterized protein LOC143017624 isoform X3 n=1 Tax=Oratosquilla oratoria TaxID=337810 RepID=UPI003F76847C
MKCEAAFRGSRQQWLAFCTALKGAMFGLRVVLPPKSRLERTLMEAYMWKFARGQGALHIRVGSSPACRTFPPAHSYLSRGGLLGSQLWKVVPTDRNQKGIH